MMGTSIHHYSIPTFNKMGLKVFLKFLSKNKLYTFVTILGFSISLMFIILLGIYVKQELSVDSFHEKKDRIYIMASKDISYASPPAGAYVKNILPEVESYTNVASLSVTVNKLVNEDKDEATAMVVDSSFFNIFTFPLLEGDKNTAIQNRQSVVLSEKYANKLGFKSSSLGKSINIDDRAYTITGIIKEFPTNSQFKTPDLILNIEVLDYYWEGGSKSWTTANSSIYFLAKKDSDLNKKSSLLLEAFKKDYLLYMIGMLEDVSFYPIEDAYFTIKQSAVGDIMKYNSKITVSIYFIITLLILIVAILNYVNLTVAQAGARGKEIAIRKLLGSDRSAIVMQQFKESVAIVTVTSVIGFLLAILAEPFFSDVLQTKIDLLSLLHINNLLVFIFGIILIALISSIIPIAVISNFEPIEIVKGTFQRKIKTIYSKILIVFQYSIAIILLICSLFIVLQTNFLKNKDVGYNKESIIAIKQFIGAEQKKTYTDILKGISGIESFSFSQGTPLTNAAIATFPKDEELLSYNSLYVDTNFFKVYKISVEPTGAALTENSAWLNKAGYDAVKHYEGEIEVTMMNHTYNVYGIVKDFNIQSLHQDVGLIRLMLLNDEMSAYDISIRLAANINQFQVAKNIEDALMKANANKPVKVVFMDDIIQKHYIEETRMAKIMTAFTLLTIVITVIGVFAMSLYMVRQKEKEIAVRKVNGATEYQVLWMLNLDSLKLVLASFIIACPIAYYTMSKWLEDFAYKISLSWWVFLAAGLVIAILTLISVSYMTWRAANTNPIDTLKKE